MIDTAPLPEGITADVVVPAKDYEKDRTIWLRERRYGIGASEISAILGVNQFRTPLQVWEEKTSDVAPTDDDMPEAAFWGLKNEHNVAQVFANRNSDLGKLAPTPGLLAHPESTILRATLDRLLVKRRTRPVTAVAGIECKTVGDFAYKNFWADGLPPVHIQLQTQWQMGVTGLDRIYVPHLVGGNWMPEAYVAERDDKVIESIFEFGESWWDRYIIGGERPAPTFADFDRMSDIFPAKPPAAVKRATDKILEAVGKHLDAKRREKEAKADKDLLAFEIQQYMGDSEELIDGDNRTITTWKRPKQSYTVDEARLKTEKPDLYEEYKKPKANNRTFVTKELD